MTLYYSTGLRDMVAIKAGYKRALKSMIMKIYGGTVPASADAAASATLLCTVSLASGAVTSEVRSAGSVTLTGGSSGSVDNITVDGIEILGAAVSYTSDLSTTASAVAAQINSYMPTSGQEYVATTSGAKIIITALPGTGTGPNGLVVATTTTTLTKTDVNMGTEVAGVAAVNTLTFGAVTAGVLAKLGTWSGVNSATGTATHFRIVSGSDDGTLSTTARRIQGSCGISGADYNMSSTTLTATRTHTVDDLPLTLPAS